MAYQLDPFTASSAADAAIDPGLRAFLSRVYWKVAGGLLLSAAVAWCIAGTPAVRDLCFTLDQGEVTGFTGWGLALLLSPLAVLFFASFALRDETGRGSGWLYWTVAALVGGSLSLLVIAYTGAALVSTFLVTAAAFGGLGFWGQVTKRNLGGLGSFLTTAVIGLVIAMLVNLFLGSPTLYVVLNALGVLVFAGLIAADNQRLKKIYYQIGETDALGPVSNYGALTLYLNFINLFELLLSFSGSRARR